MPVSFQFNYNIQKDIFFYYFAEYVQDDQMLAIASHWGVKKTQQACWD